ncbi:hypothetical protein Tco_0106989 [Tanacetum coccineum]
MAVRCRTQVSERILRRRRVIVHLENVKGCHTYRWLRRLKANQMEDLGHLGVINAFMDKMYAAVRKREKDLPMTKDWFGKIHADLVQRLSLAFVDRYGVAEFYGKRSTFENEREIGILVDE